MLTARTWSFQHPYLFISSPCVFYIALYIVCIDYERIKIIGTSIIIYEKIQKLQTLKAVVLVLNEINQYKNTLVIGDERKIVNIFEKINISWSFATQDHQP